MAQLIHDEEDGFGDFKFASLPIETVHSLQINGRNSTATAADDEDEWSDFVESPLQNSGFSRTQSYPESREPTKPFDAFGFFSDQSTESVSGRVEPEKTKTTQWAKPRGALPLSLFGDVEDEGDQSGKDPLPEKKMGNSKSATNMNSGTLINNIANLYSPSDQIKADNGLNSNSKLNSDMNRSTFNDTWLNLNSGFASERKDFHITTLSNGLSLDSKKDSTWNISGLNWDTNPVTGNKDFNVMTDMNNQNQQTKPETGESSKLNGFNSSLNISTSNASGSILEPHVSTPNHSAPNSNHYNASGSILESHVSTPHHSAPNSNNYNASGSILEFHVSTPNHSAPNPNHYGLNSNSDLIGSNEKFEDDDDDDGWEFQDAYSELKVVEEKAKVGRNGLENAELTAYSSGFANNANGPNDLFAASNVNGPNDLFATSKANGPNDLFAASNGNGTNDLFAASNGNGTNDLFAASNGNVPNDLFAAPNGNGPNDLFAASNEVSSKSSEVNIGFDLKAPTVAQKVLSSDPYLKSEQDGNEDILNSDTLHSTEDDNFGEFTNAFSESSTLKHEGKELKSKESHKGALPLSIFGDEEQEIDDSINSPSLFTFQSAMTPRKRIESRGSNLSVNDLISSLYSQADSAQQIPSVETSEKLTEKGLDFTTTVFDSDIVDLDDDLDDDSWEFKDASSLSGAKDETFLVGSRDAHESTHVMLNDYVDFFSKLIDELCFAVRYHFDHQKAQNTAATVSGEDMKLTALDEEIQEACQKLHLENLLSKEFYREDHAPRVICIDEFLEVLHKPKFNMLEAKYHLSTQLPSAKNDLRSAFELLKHVTSTLNVLKLATMEEQYAYVSTWSKVITVCAQELKHGAQIWKKSLEYNLRSQLLSEPRGKQYIVGLGEVYRVLVIIGASTKLYKPWIVVSNYIDSKGIYAVLEECHTLWRSSGLEAAIQSMSDENDTTIKSLLESIKHVRDLDENHVFSLQVSKCQLSLLTVGTVPEMKMVVWNGEHYLVKLANLWANLISSDPPKLPHINIS